MGWIAELEEEERIKRNEKLENLEKAIYLIKEEIKGWDKETPEGLENILAEVERFIKELEDV